MKRYNVSPNLLVLLLLGASPPLISEGISEKSGNRYWEIGYALSKDFLIKPENLTVEISGLVSNSRVPSHSRPIKVEHILASNSKDIVYKIIDSHDPATECSEIASSELRTEKDGSQTLVIRLEHCHLVYGPHDPLLAQRSFALIQNGKRVEFTLNMTEPTKFKPPKRLWPPNGDPPPERRDIRFFVSAPDSLLLDANAVGEQSYRYRELQVKYSTKLKLSFWYYATKDVDDECHARVCQYRDGNSWKYLTDAQMEIVLEKRGKWTRVQKVFRTDDQATSLTLEFRMMGDNGCVWIDDVDISPLKEEGDRL
jgi:hypothetical protein